MNDQMGVDTSPDPDLRVDSEGPLSIPTYEVPDEDKALADEILAMDVLRDVPGPFKGLEFRKEPALTLGSLPPAMRDKIELQLRMVPPSKYAETERELVRAALTENSMTVRATAGVGSAALPVHKTMAEVAAQHRQLGREFDGLSADLARIKRHDTVTDQTTGALKPVPVYELEGEARAQVVRRQEELVYRMNLLAGVEGDRRIRKSLLESIAQVKQRREALAENAEVEKRAAQAVREERLERRVAARVKSIGPNTF